MPTWTIFRPSWTMWTAEGTGWCDRSWDLLCYVPDDLNIATSIRSNFSSKDKGRATGNIPPKVLSVVSILASPESHSISSRILLCHSIPPIYYCLLLLLLLSRFSCVQLCVTPETAAHQAPSSLGFSRQEHWSGLPFPSPMHESEKWK